MDKVVEDAAELEAKALGRFVSSAGGDPTRV